MFVTFLVPLSLDDIMDYLFCNCDKCGHFHKCYFLLLSTSPGNLARNIIKYAFLVFRIQSYFYLLLLPYVVNGFIKSSCTLPFMTKSWQSI